MSLKIVHIKEKAAVQAHTPASLKTILTPSRIGEIEEDFIGCEKVPSVASVERSINHKPVAIANWRSPVSDKLLKAIPIR
jgi:hypothetical protein